MRTPHLGSAAGVTALCLLAVTACSGGGGGAEDDTLNVWMYQDSLAAVQGRAIDRFNEESELATEMNEIPADNYEERLRTAMGSSEQPDVFFNWGSGSIEPYVEQEMLAPMDDVLADNPEFSEAFIPTIMESGKVDDVQYGIPLRGTQPVMIFFNKAVFEEVGVEPPETWEDVLDLIDAFNEADVIPFALAGSDAWTEQMWLQYFVDRIGGSEVFARIAEGDPEGWRDPAVLEAAEMVQDLVERGAFGESYGSVSYTEGAASALLSEGRAAMHLMGSFEYSTHLDGAPDFVENDLGYVAFPALPEGEGDPANVVGNPTNYFSVSADSPYVEEAMDFLVQEMSSEEYVADMVENGEVPTTVNAEEAVADSPDPEFATFQYEMVRDAPHFQLSWDQALPPEVATPMLTQIQSLFNGEITPEQFVDALAAR